ncbi:MAG: LruC domain-containing protein [Phocaeicola sp.]
MKYFKRKSIHSWGVALFCACSLSGCIDRGDLFDPEVATEIYKATFPVQNVDIDQTWATTRVVSLHLSMVEESSKSYSLSFYTDNPLNVTNEALLLGNVDMTGDEQTTLSLDLPDVYTSIYVLRKDEAGNKTLKAGVIENNQVSFTWGALASQSQTRAFSTASQVPTSRALADIYPTSVPSDAQEFNGSVSQGTKYIVRASDRSINAHQSNVSLYVVEDVNLAELYIGPHCKFYIMPGVTVTYGKDVFVAQDGSMLSIGSGSKFSNPNFRLTVGWNSSLYNLGTLELSELNMNAGRFVNDAGAIAQTKSTVANSHGSIWENRGFYATNSMAISSGGLTLTNYCKVVVNGVFDLRDNSFSMDAGSSLECESAYFNNATLQLGGFAYFKVNGVADFGYNNFVRGVGSDSGKPALLWMQKATNNSSNFSATYQNNLLIACNDHFPHERDQWNPYYKLEGAAQLVGAENVTITIPSSECNVGINNQITPDPEIPSQIYTYAFEDNYPQPGDYDFNDVILDVVSPRRNGNKIEIQVTLQALGATKHLGAGVRIMGEARKNVLSVNYLGEHLQDFRATWGGRNEVLMGGVNANGFEKDCGDDLVVPLFGDGHAVFGATGRGMINTSTAQQVNYAPRTMVFELQFKTGTDTKDFSLENDLDFFLTHNQVTSMSGQSYHHNPRVEVHLFANRDNPTYRGTTFDHIKQVAGKITWGICAPSFKYPLEYTSITTAYNRFEVWAQNMETYQDWHQYPTTGKTWR